MQNLKKSIESAWEQRAVEKSKEEILELKKEAFKALDMLDSGKLRVAEKIEGKWLVNEWVKKAILLVFKYSESMHMNITSELNAFDKIPLKCANYKGDDFNNAGFRLVPGAVVRYGAYIGKNVILMPSFVNIGAYIGENSMVDTWATVGSCAQIGKNCHISGGAGIGGVLEPLQASPVIIEDNVFIGARSEVVEGVIIGQGAVLSMGVYIGASTKIYDRQTGNIMYGAVPPYSVVVPGTLPSEDARSSTYAAIIVKKVDDKTRRKTSINELLRT